MKKITTHRKAFLHLAAVVALSLMVFMSINVRKAESFSTADALTAVGCNATRISDCLPDDEEFLMESESSRRILQSGGGGNTITYPVLNPQRTHCDRDVYGSCIGNENKIYTQRTCNYQNNCGRSGN